eukprot:85328_1
MGRAMSTPNPTRSYQICHRCRRAKGEHSSPLNHTFISYNFLPNFLKQFNLNHHTQYTTFLLNIFLLINSIEGSHPRAKYYFYFYPSHHLLWAYIQLHNAFQSIPNLPRDKSCKLGQSPMHWAARLSAELMRGTNRIDESSVADALIATMDGEWYVVDERSWCGGGGVWCMCSPWRSHGELVS